MTGGDDRSLGSKRLLVVALVALAVRVGYQLEIHADLGAGGVLALHHIGDERAYDHLAREVADGSLSRDRAFYQEPLYAWLVAQLYQLWPPTAQDPEATVVVPDPVHRAVVLCQHGLGIVVALLTALLGTRALGARVGLLAGLLAALSGPAVFHEAMLLKATLSLVVLLAGLHLWLDVLEGAGRQRAVPLGLVLGAGILLRGNMYLLAAAVAASLVVPLGTDRRRFATLAQVTVGALLAVSPAWIHNARAGDPGVLTTYQSGTNAAIGQPADDRVDRGIIYEPLRAGRGDAMYEEADAVAVAEEAEGRRLSGSEVSSWWWSRVRERVSERPWVALQRAGWKLVHLFHGYEVPDVKDWSFFAEPLPWTTTSPSPIRWLSTPLSNMWVLGPWALLGFVLLPWRRRPGLVVVRGGVLVVAVTLVLFYVMGRYRLSAAPCLWILAAGAADLGWRRLRERGGALRKVAVLALAVATPAALATLDLPSEVNGHHTSFANAATIEKTLAERAETEADARRHRDRAVDFARRAVEIAPLFVTARTTLARSLSLETPLLAPRKEEAWDASLRALVVLEGLRTGVDVREPLTWDTARLPEALERLVDMPGLPEGEAFTAPLLETASLWVIPGLRSPAELPLALKLVDRVLRLGAEDPMALALRGQVLKRMGRVEEAEAAYRAAVDAGADGVEIHNNLGNVLLRLGRVDDAIVHFRRALELVPDSELVARNLQRALDQRDAIRPGEGEQR